MGNQWRRLGFQVGGPLLALVAAGGIELLSRGVFQIPNPPAILIMLVVLSGIMGGFGSGMVTAAIAWLFFAYFFSVPGLPLHYTADNFRRVVVWAVTMPATVVMAGLLKRRAEHTLEITKENAVLAGQVQAERRYRGLFNSVPIGLFRTSPDGTILDANPALVDMLGFPSREALLAVNIADVHVDPQQRNEALAQINATGHVEALDRQFRRRDGTAIWVRVNARIVRDEHEPRFEGAILDITARRQAETELRALNDQLEDRIRERTLQLEAANQELEAFAYSVAHDLRAPLITIDGFSRMLLEDYLATLPEEAQRYLHEVAKSAHQMSQLIDDLLTFSRLNRQPMRDQSVNLTELAHTVLQELDGSHPHSAVHISALPPCQGDPALLKQVFVNLLSNALKFSRIRAQPIVEIGSHEADDPKRWTYFVRDNGAGFDMQYVHKLFRVFQRLHRAEEFEGTGVGLAIVQRIVHRHGGRVWAEAEPDKGATFSFTLRRSDAA